MLFVTMNRLGQSGKTTIARYVLTPRLKDALMLSAESSTHDGAENLLIRSVGKDGAMTLDTALAGMAGLGRPVVLDVGSVDTDVALPLVIAHAARGHSTHVVIPFRAAAKAASAAVTLLEELERKPGIIVSMVANGLQEAADLKKEGYQALARQAEAKGARLLSVGLTQNEWLLGAGKLSTFDDIRAAAETDATELSKRCAEAFSKAVLKHDMSILNPLSRERAKIDAAKVVLEKTQAVFDALIARQAEGKAEGAAA